MSIYRRDAVLPEWEPVPHNLEGRAADEQERGFHKRAIKPIRWRLVPFADFPKSGIFGHGRDWFSENDIEGYAAFDGEDLVLIHNFWHGFPDPPEWGLASRPSGTVDRPWSMWGHVPKLPDAWVVPRREAVDVSDEDQGSQGR